MWKNDRANTCEKMIEPTHVLALYICDRRVSSGDSNRRGPAWHISFAIKLSRGVFVADLHFNKIDSSDLKAFKDIQAQVMAEIMSMITSGDVEIKIKRKKRTSTQNASIHKYCDLLATAYNDAGFDQQIVLAQQAAVPWSQNTVKESQWRRIQIAMGLPESTTELETADVSKVHQVLNRHTIEKFNINIAFPSMDVLRFNSI